jgi:ribose-phosphate pyrophosphokinase
MRAMTGGPNSPLPAAPGPSQDTGTSLSIRSAKRLMIFSGRSHRRLAGSISDRLGVDLGAVTLKTFSQGEVYCRYEESVRGADVFIIQPTCGNAAAGVSANDAVMELLVMIDAAVGASAHRVISVTPWFGYCRQDKKSAPREPISARLAARMIESAGSDRLVTMDLHTGQAQGFFRKPVDHLTSLGVLADYFEGLALPDAVVLAPDAGRVKFGKKFASKIGAELAILDRHRAGREAHEVPYVIGDVRGKSVIVLDDIVDTGRTLLAARRALIEAGARVVYAAATHPVMSGAAIENLAASDFEEIVLMDTIPIRSDIPPSVRVLTCADLLTDSIRRIFVNDSVSEVFGGDNQLL